MASLAALVGRYPALRLTIVDDSAAADGLRRRLVAAGAPADRVQNRTGSPPRAQITVDPRRE